MHIHPDIVLFAILLVLIFGIFIRIIYFRARKTAIDLKWTQTIKHLGQISLALGVLLQLIELSTALEHTTNLLTTDEIANGLRSTLFSTAHGLLVYIVAMILFIILNLTAKKGGASANDRQQRA
jgi:hypothetical protein